MKILQVTNFFKPSWESGGPARVAYEISKMLVEMGSIKEEGGEAREFDDKYNWDDIVDDFEGILEGMI